MTPGNGWSERACLFLFSWTLIGPSHSLTACRNRGDERYLANSSGGRRPVAIIDEGGLVLKLLPDLATVEEQMEALASLP